MSEDILSSLCHTEFMTLDLKITKDEKSFGVVDVVVAPPGGQNIVLQLTDIPESPFILVSTKSQKINTILY